MNLAFVLAFASLMTVALLGMTQANQLVDHPQAAQSAMAEVDLYRMFMYSADQYMKQTSLADVSAQTNVTWDAIKVASTTPPGAKNLAIPVTWKIVVTPGKKWVACTDMDERSVGAIAQLAPPSTDASSPQSLTPLRLTSANSASVTHIVISPSSTAAAFAAQCS